jgi:hypothetical protein
VLAQLSTTPLTCMGERRYSSTLLDLGTTRRQVVSFTSLPLYPWGSNPQYPLHRRLGGPQSQSGHCGVKINLSALLGIKLQLFQPIARHYTDSAIPVPSTHLSWHKIVMMLHEIILITALQGLAAGGTNTSGRWICQEQSLCHQLLSVS